MVPNLSSSSAISLILLERILHSREKEKIGCSSPILKNHYESPWIQRDCEKAKSTEMIGFSRSAISVLNGAEPSITETPNSDLIHMDVDQSFLPAPSLVKAAIFESFAGQNMLVLCCILEGGPLCFPAGSNGNYVSAAKFLKANIVNIPTEYEVGFKVTEKTLVTILETVKKPWVNISGPTVNPTGLLYSNRQSISLLLSNLSY
ncbi:hypothetical protein KPL70_013640 [Citrus sinensis]|nr:hypothetical protein KPL70_013640 [Citrus sinensis]